MHLITRSDISGRDMRLKDGSSEAIQREVDEALEAMGLAEFGGARRDVVVDGTAGTWYANFLESINDAMEDRDTQLALLHVCVRSVGVGLIADLWKNQHRSKAASLEAQHSRAIVHARAEHKALSQTIQQRLSTRLKASLKRLAAEKDSSSNSANALSSLSTFGDITETNALLHHPSNYGLVAGISSPRRHGGPTYLEDAGSAEVEKETPGASRRKPRRRAGELEELLAFGAGMNFDSSGAPGKRKRRGGAAGDEHTGDIRTPPVDESAAENNSPPSMPSSREREKDKEKDAKDMRDAEDLRRRGEIFKQAYAPVFSIEKLFTEKELQLHANQARLATFRYFTEKQALEDAAAEAAAGAGDDNQHHGSGDAEAADTTPTGGNTPAPGDDTASDTAAATAAAAAPTSAAATAAAPAGGGAGTSGAGVGAAGGNGTAAAADDRDRSPTGGEQLSRSIAAAPAYSVNTRSNPPRSSGNKDLEGLVASGMPPIGMSYVNKAGIAPPPPQLRAEDVDSDLDILRRICEPLPSASSGGGGKRRTGTGGGDDGGFGGAGTGGGGKKVRRG